MLAIISDLGITDGTTGHLLPAGTMDLLCERLCYLAWRASWRADGSSTRVPRAHPVSSSRAKRHLRHPHAYMIKTRTERFACVVAHFT